MCIEMAKRAPPQERKHCVGWIWMNSSGLERTWRLWIDVHLHAFPGNCMDPDGNSRMCRDWFGFALGLSHIDELGRISTDLDRFGWICPDLDRL